MMRQSRQHLPATLARHNDKQNGDDMQEIGSYSSMQRVPPSFLSIASALLYGLISISMSFVNKYTLTTFPMPMVVIVTQMIITLAAIQLLLSLGIINFPTFNIPQCKSLFWITLLYTGNTAFALYGLVTLNIPMYSTLKRLTPMIVLLTKVHALCGIILMQSDHSNRSQHVLSQAVIRRRWPDQNISLSVLVVVLGCVIAGIGDLSFEMTGYMYAVMSCLAQAGYFLLVEFQGAGGIGTSELLYYNAITSLPILMGMIGLSGDASNISSVYAASIHSHGTAKVITAILLSSAAGGVLNFALFFCVVNNSALTTTIVGVLKGVVVVVAGFFFFNSAPVGAVNVLGIAVNTCGSIWYTWLKYKQKNELKDTSSSAEEQPLLNGHTKDVLDGYDRPKSGVGIA